jgi:hypothetical protein
VARSRGLPPHTRRCTRTATWRGRLVQHRRLDVQTLVEIPTRGAFGWCS